jgi:formylglycine-generating enzyme required for sulfatase activity/serine/threonine protein kinase
VAVWDCFLLGKGAMADDFSDSQNPDDFGGAEGEGSGSGSFDGATSSGDGSSGSGRSFPIATFDPEVLKAGQRLANAYTLKRAVPTAIGDEMVWIADDEVTGKEVSVHFIPNEVALDPQLIADLRSEFRKAKQLIHPNILRVIDLIEEPDWTGMVMDTFTGESLTRMLQEQPGGFFDSDAAIRWLQPLLDTLKEVHAIGVVHGDVTPMDMILEPSGHLFMCDFGISRLVTDALRRVNAAGDNAAYSPADVLDGATPTVADDVYGLSATVYNLVTGKTPFEAEDIEAEIRSGKGLALIGQRLRAQVRAAMIPAQWERAILAGLSPNPADRPQSIAALEDLFGTNSTPDTVISETKDSKVAGGSDVLDEDSGREESGVREISRPVGSKKSLTEDVTPKKRRGAGLWVAALIVVGLGVGAYFGIPREEKAIDLGGDGVAEVPKGESVGEGGKPVKGNDVPFTPPLSQEDATKLAALTPGNPKKEGDDSDGGLPPVPPTGPAMRETKSGEALPPPVPPKPTNDAAANVTPEQLQAAERKMEALTDRLMRFRDRLKEAEISRAEIEKVLSSFPKSAGKNPQREGLMKQLAEKDVEIKGIQDSADVAEKELHIALTDWESLKAAKAPTKPEPTENSLGMRFVQVGDVMMATHETRVKDYAVFAEETKLKRNHWKSPGFEQTPDHPVVFVSWEDAMAFCRWLTEKEQKAKLLTKNESYRLPYDKEWSDAVGLPKELGNTAESRDSGNIDHFPWGSQWPPVKGAGNYTGEETGSEVAIKGYRDGFQYTAPVASFPANANGLFDLGGNVWEWCMDAWNVRAKSKVLRGGSWYNGSLQVALLSSCRIHSLPDRESDAYGFRIVKVTTAKK